MLLPHPRYQVTLYMGFVMEGRSRTDIRDKLRVYSIESIIIASSARISYTRLFGEGGCDTRALFAQDLIDQTTIQ